RVLVEGQGTSDDGAPLVVGRSFRDAPEVDGQVFAWGVAQPGSFVNVRVTQALEYDLWCDLACEPRTKNRRARRCLVLGSTSRSVLFKRRRGPSTLSGAGVARWGCGGPSNRPCSR